MSPVKAGPDYFAPTEKRYAALDRSAARRELLAVADQRGHLATTMALAAGAIEDVLALPEWDADDWTPNARRRVQTERRKADQVYTDALEIAFDAITAATEPSPNTNTEHVTTNAPELANKALA